MHVIAYEGSGCYFLVEFGADAVDEVLVDLDDLVLLLDLLVEGLTQVLDGGRDLHLLLGHQHAPVLVGHLRLQVLDHGLGPLHLLEEFAVLGLEASHLLLDVLRHADPLILLSLQLPLDAFQLHLVLLLHGAEGVDQLLDDFEGFLDGVAILLAGGHGLPFQFSLSAFFIEVLLEFDDLVGELFDFLLVDVGEVVDVGVVELFDRFGQFRVDVYELLQRPLEGCVLLIEHAVLLAEVFDVGGEVGLFLTEEGGRHRHLYNNGSNGHALVHSHIIRIYFHKNIALLLF